MYALAKDAVYDAKLGGLDDFAGRRGAPSAESVVEIRVGQ
jgi:hypothetical protein